MKGRQEKQTDKQGERNERERERREERREKLSSDVDAPLPFVTRLRSWNPHPNTLCPAIPVLT